MCDEKVNLFQFIYACAWLRDYESISWLEFPQYQVRVTPWNILTLNLGLILYVYFKDGTQYDVIYPEKSEIKFPKWLRV